MANYRTTKDIVDSVLTRSGEVTNGNSAYEARVLEILNRIHQTLLIGGNEFNIEVDETWLWALAPDPIVLELQPKYDTGTVSLTKGSEAGTFSSAPSSSLKGWHLRIPGRDGVFKIRKHVAGEAAFEIDGAYDGNTGATLGFDAFKLDYVLEPTYITIDSTNNKIDFEETASSELTATLTNGVYTPGDLATEIDTQLTAAGASAYTITYDSNTQKFTLASDRAGGGGTFKLLCATGSNQANSVWASIGFDDEDQADAASHTGQYPIGGIARLGEPMTIYKGYYGKDGQCYGIERSRFKQDYPLTRIIEEYPTKFAKLHVDYDGITTVRFNAYPTEETRIEIDYVPQPRDLKDNEASIPKIPRKFIDVLEYGTAGEILFEKSDDKHQGYISRAAAKLQSMVTQNRGELHDTGKFFGQVIARDDLLLSTRRKLIYGIPEES